MSQNGEILNVTETKEIVELNEPVNCPFEALGLSGPLLQVIRQKFQAPTLIQEKTIPLALAGVDIIAGSATGSGKTLAFGAGILQSAKKGNGIQALILTPTRELAEQVAKNLKLFSANKPLKIKAVYGGVSINPQITDLKKAEIVVGTPGRILDHINRKTILLNKVNTLVLDEADTMLDMGFIHDVESIIKNCPKERQTLLFSATISSEINNLAKRHTKDAARISATPSVDPSKLKQVYYQVNDEAKFSLLSHLLKHEDTSLAMIFCNSRRRTDIVTRKLKSAGFNVEAIHGGFSQSKRNSVIKQFHSKRAHVLVCTDVAARGLDISGVSHVYNYDIPSDSKQYVHRIGRTARAGMEGKAVNIINKADFNKFSRVLWENGIEEIDEEKVPCFEIVKN